MASPQKNVNTHICHILFFSLFFFAHFFAYSQRDPLEIRATLQMQQEPIENVLTEITTQTGVRFSYNSQLINPKTEVTVMVENIAIREILYSVLPVSVSFKKVGEHIIFTDNGKLTNDCLSSVSEPKEAPNRPKDTLSLTNEEDMKAQIAGMMMALATVSVPVAAQDTIIPQNEVQQQVKCRPAQLTFFYPLGTGFAKSKEKCYHLSINILGGATGYVKGFEAGGLFNINKYEVKGVQLAGIFNVANSVTFQAGGIFNIAKEGGVQMAGIFNIGKNTHFQAAGIFNTVKKTKCQMAGIFNVAQESYVQIAGILNVTKKGCFQMGLINVRDTADGVSLGLINIVKHGGVLEAGIEASEFVHTAATFRSGVQRLYSILSVGYNYKQGFWAMGYGLGTSFKLIEKLSLNLELTYTQIYNELFFMNSSDLIYDEWNATLIQFSPILNYRIVKHFKVYLGPRLNILLRNNAGISNATTFPPYKMYHKTFSCSTLDMWIGVVGGLKF